MNRLFLLLVFIITSCGGGGSDSPKVSDTKPPVTLDIDATIIEKYPVVEGASYRYHIYLRSMPYDYIHVVAPDGYTAELIDTTSDASVYSYKSKTKLDSLTLNSSYRYSYIEGYGFSKEFKF